LLILLPDSELALVVLLLGLLDGLGSVQFEGVLVFLAIEFPLVYEAFLGEHFELGLFMRHDIRVIGEGGDDFPLGFNLFIHLGK